MDELGRQPYSARDFLIRWQDRVLFGADMPICPNGCTDATSGSWRPGTSTSTTPAIVGEDTNFVRWKIYGLGLPDGVLEKIYRKNALRIIPGLEEVAQ